MRRQKTENGRRTFTFYSLSSAICPLLSVFCLLIFNSGCLETNKQQTTPVDQVDKLKKQNAQLQKQVEQLKSENEELKGQVQVLSGVPEQVKGENLYHLQKIRIGRYTNLYDKDKDGKMERLIVYIQPIDEDGDIIKAAGDADVQLWNLSKEQDQALLCKGHVEPEELKKLWFSTLMTHYRLEFDVTGKIDEFKDPLTVKVVFTDYLTGKVFKEQKVIEPN